MSTLQFVPFDSRVNPDFWFSLSKLKLDVLKLQEEPHPIVGRIEQNNQGVNVPPILDVDRFSFESKSSKSDATSLLVDGFICNQNTIETFKNVNKPGLIENVCGLKLRQSFQNCSALLDPGRHLNPFIVLTFADLKKYNFYFWFAFPAFKMPEELQVVSMSPAPDLTFQKEDLSPYFAIHNGKTLIDSLQNAIDLFNSNEDVIFGFCDSCTYDNHPGWALRNYLALILYHSPGKTGLKILCYRRRAESKLLELKCNGEPFDLNAALLGWEKNENGKLGPRVAAMKNSMDPSVLAESSVDLNLKLMKWRVAPDLDLGRVSKLKVLLLGSGTLGCNVARVCLGWGIRHITFVDNSKVSFSNPARQSLFEFNDCLNGGEHKAKCASDRLKSIFPGVTSKWHDIFIPMPGHPISEANLTESQKNFDQLQELIKEHDMIFLLMDSRESRWLPTLLGTYHKKMVLNAALGFDTFLVMRHGMHPKKYGTMPSKDEETPGDELGCYFCNDVVAPGDSLKDRTLDQQCTVTRPGMSFQASALVVELAMSMVQHPKRALAPAGGNAEENGGVLGIVPHSIRGSANGFTQFCPTTSAFDRCTACSPAILKEFQEDKFEFIKRVCNSPASLEDITGLSKLLSDTILEDMIALDSEEEN